MDILFEFIKNRNDIAKVAINRELGGFALTKEMAEELNIDPKSNGALIFGNYRNNPVLIALVEKHKPESIQIMEIDWWNIPNAYLVNHDGMEHIEYGREGANNGYPLMDFMYEGKYNY